MWKKEERHATNKMQETLYLCPSKVSLQTKYTEAVRKHNK